MKKNNIKEPIYNGKKFDVEHALGMYAYSFYTLPAEAIYDKIVLSQLENRAKKCHIYLIGYTPKIDFTGARIEDQELIMTFKVLGNFFELKWELKPGCKLIQDDGKYFIQSKDGVRFFPSKEEAICRLCAESGKILFNVKYIGQGYGKGGSRNALDRLKSHETLQKIAIKGVPVGYRLEIMLLEVHSNNSLITMFNPNAVNKDEGKQRILAGIDKLFDTNEAERITLYEASLIRYFQPEFNVEFKDSFPSTKMKVLMDCYDKDFSAVVAEINFDDVPFLICSDSIAAKSYHIANHDLHDEADRKVFFSSIN